MANKEPWSKRHKQVTRAATGGLPFSLSNSFAEPLRSAELLALTKARGDQALVDAFMDHPLTYTANGGSLDLRAEIAKQYGPNISADHIIVFTGAQVALQTAAMALVGDGGSHSIVFTPGYQSVQEAPGHAGSQVTKIVLRAEANWQIDPEEVRAAIRPDTRYIVINEPFNPAGTLMSYQRQDELKAIAEQYGIYLLCDEVYRLLEHDPANRLPAMADLYDKGLSVVTMSKPWGACGVTIGWVATQDLHLRQRLLDVQYFGTACPSRASELQAMMALRASDTILRKNLLIIRHNLGLLDRFMEDFAGWFEWVRPRAGAVAFIRFKGPLTSSELGEALAEAGISIKPAYIFTDAVTEANDYFRVGFGERVMPRALEALTAFVQQHQQEWREAGSRGAKSPL